MPENHFSSELHFTVRMVDSIKKKKIKRFIQDETKVPGRGTVTVPVESESP